MTKVLKKLRDQVTLKLSSSIASADQFDQQARTEEEWELWLLNGILDHGYEYQELLQAK